MKSIFLYCSILILFIGNGLLAQNDPKSQNEKANEGESFILTDISYSNDAIFMGRRDSIAAPYILSSIGYYDRSGWFADLSLSYLTRSEEQRVDLFLVSGGYLFESKKWSGGLSGTAYFYNKDSYNVQSEVVADVTGILSYDLKALELSVYASSYFNKNSTPDIFLGLMAERTFYAFDRNFLITPRVSLYAGSQYFYEEYYSTSRLGNRKGQGMGPGGSGSTEVNSVQIAEASEFNFLNVALSIPIQYQHKQFIFSFDPIWAFPQTSATLTTEDTVFQEKLDNVFYWSAGISYWFLTTKEK